MISHNRRQPNLQQTRLLSKPKESEHEWFRPRPGSLVRFEWLMESSDAES